MKLYAAHFDGFGVQDPPEVEPLPQSKVPRMSDERYEEMVREGLAKAKARKAKGEDAVNTLTRARQKGFEP